MTRNAAISMAAVAVAALAFAEERPAGRPDLEIVLMIDGGFTPSEPHLFLLKVGFSGDISGGGDLNPGLPAPPDRLSVSAHARIAALLERERFFDKPNRNLGCITDLGGRSIEAWRGTTQRRVSFCPDADGVPLRDIQSVLRVWYGVLKVVGNGGPIPVTDVDKRTLARKP
jgi:hypothetical protein